MQDVLKNYSDYVTDLFLEVLGEIEVGEDNTFNNKTDGYGTDEVIAEGYIKEIIAD